MSDPGFDKAWANYVEDEQLHGTARKALNPFKMGDVVVCVERVSGQNIAPGDTGVCGPHNATLIRFNGAICPASNFRLATS